jgi:hypothetical protein
MIDDEGDNAEIFFFFLRKPSKNETFSDRRVFSFFEVLSQKPPENTHDVFLLLQSIPTNTFLYLN